VKQGKGIRGRLVLSSLLTLVLVFTTLGLAVGLAFAEPETQSAGTSGGVFSFSGGAVSIDVPNGALTETVDLRVTSHTVATSPAPAPAGATLGSQVFTLEVLKGGAVQSAYKFSRLVEITVSYSAADKSAAGTPILNTLKLYVYDSVSGAWLELGSITDVVNETLTTAQLGTGVFALVAKPTLPSTGGWAPSSGMVMGVMLAGFLMMLTGSGYYVVRLRGRSRS
jgi:hypothetical protein